MTPAEEARTKGRAAARTAANELSDLYITESARIKNEHGLDAAITFLEALRDNLIAIRPFPVKVEEKPAPTASKQRHGTGWDERDIPDRYVLVPFQAECEAETDKAVKVGDMWIPKSQLLEVPEVGDYLEDWPVTQWFADKEGLE